MIVMRLDDASRVYVRRGQRWWRFDHDHYGVKRAIQPGDDLVIETNGILQDATVVPSPNPAFGPWNIVLTRPEVG
jgi:hypothetical protein